MSYFFKPNDMENHFNQSPLNFRGQNRLYVLKVIKALHEIPRTGWVDRGVQNPETVGEHSDELIILANHFYPFVTNLDKMLKIHDWPETDKALGDIRTDSLCPPERRWTPENKYKAELAAMEKICLPLGVAGDELFQLWLEFEAGETERAKIAKQLDKLQAIKKAIFYQTQGQTVVAQEFVDYNGPKITRPELIKAMEKAALRLKTKTLVC